MTAVEMVQRSRPSARALPRALVHEGWVGGIGLEVVRTFDWLDGQEGRSALMHEHGKV